MFLKHTKQSKSQKKINKNHDSQHLQLSATSGPSISPFFFLGSSKVAPTWADRDPSSATVANKIGFKRLSRGDHPRCCE